MQKFIPTSLKLLLLSLAASSTVLVPVSAKEANPGEEREESALPFSAGERLTYTIKWGIIRAGTAVLEVHPMMKINGEEVHHFSLSITTTSFVDNFYKVRDRIDGFARADLEGSVLYMVKKDAGKNLRDVTVSYDAAAGLAKYSNFGEAKEPVEIAAGTLDPLSVIFSIRTRALEEASEIRLPISDGRRASTGVARVGKTERVRVPAGKYDAILLEPDMGDVGGVFEKSGDSPMQIWFSTDERRVPVRISSRVAVGSFRADLVSVEQMTPDELAGLVAARAEVE